MIESLGRIWQVACSSCATVIETRQAYEMEDGSILCDDCLHERVKSKSAKAESSLHTECAGPGDSS